MPDATRHFDVFVSYDHRDTQLATRLRNALTSRGAAVWLDSKAILPGERWGRSIEGALESSSTFVVVATRNAMTSRWVETEYLAALVVANRPSSRLRLMALLFEPVNLPLILSTFQSVDFRTESQFDAAIETLLTGILAARGLEGERPTVGISDASAPASKQHSKAELEYLGKAMRRERQNVRHTLAVRTAAPVLGFLVSVMVTALGLVPLWPAALTLALATSLTMGLVGWAATAQWLTEAQARIEKLALLQDGLTDCDQRPRLQCDEFRIEFWRTFHGGALIQS
jgi:TIR domain-containing protein